MQSNGPQYQVILPLLCETSGEPIDTRAKAYFTVIRIFEAVGPASFERHLRDVINCAVLAAGNDSTYTSFHCVHLLNHYASDRIALIFAEEEVNTIAHRLLPILPANLIPRNDRHPDLPGKKGIIGLLATILDAVHPETIPEEYILSIWTALERLLEDEDARLADLAALALIRLHTTHCFLRTASLETGVSEQVNVRIIEFCRGRYLSSMAKRRLGPLLDRLQGGPVGSPELDVSYQSLASAILREACSNPGSFYDSDSDEREDDGDQQAAFLPMIHLSHDLQKRL
ncbi:hypothetical protein NLJ89_g9847 [Agrocybe chaxingu]|uniref:Uncharacterized protein n=1 Tax=Agrocybe chaxingu TaxID=84603 RepID=A0A9W8MT58_9AGAR|nr:hypothetical protein NLJ89_g9847 [Agrocybe chaxingu]